MAVLDFIQTSLGAGELTPRLRGRLDFDRFFDGVALLQNFVVLPQGGAQRRSGTRFVAEVKDSTDFTRLIPFQFSTSQAYVIEFGDQYVRFFRDEGVVGAPYELASPYSASDLPFLKWTQSADVLFLCHPDYQPEELQRLADTNWQFVDFDFQDGPYQDTNTTSTTLTLSGTSGSVTVTASGTTGINGGDGFQSTDVGRLIRWQDPASEWTWLEITAVADTTHCTATIRGQNASAGTATTTWRLGSWSDTTGWPHCATFFQDRLCFGATDSEPQTIWCSETGDFNSFSPSAVDGTVADDNAVNLPISNNQVNAIRWMAATSRGLSVGTSGSELVLQSNSTVDPFGPNTAEVVRQSNRGSSVGDLPALIGHSLVFIQRGSEVLRELLYDFNVDGFVTRDLTILSEHLSTQGIADISYQQNPDSIIWLREGFGELLGLTFEREQKVFAWHHHPLGGTFDGDIPVVESICSIGEEGDDQVWMIVKRDIDGSTVRYVEFLEELFEDADVVEDAFFVDSGLTYSGASTTTITGLDHLEGETVAVLADGATHPDKVVSGGSITLERSATKVQVGLAYLSVIDTLPFEVVTDTNTTRGKTKRIHQVHVLFNNTLGGTVGERGADDQMIIPTRAGGDPMDSAPPLFSETKTVKIPASHTKDAQVTIEQSQPLPMTVLNIVNDSKFHGS